jgi:uncharacterized membrane protein
LSSLLLKLKSSEFVVVLFLQLITFLATIFNIQIFRQFFGFIYLTFIPGYILIKLLKLQNLNRLGKVLYSLGLSISFLMITGLIINEISLSFGVLNPLSLFILLPILTTLIFIMSFFVYLRDDEKEILSNEPNLSIKHILLFLLLPIFSIIGVISVNLSGNNLLLLMMFIIISVLCIICILYKSLIPTNLYSLVILIIAISLLFSNSLISNQLSSFNSDNMHELLVFKNTLNNSYWSSANIYSYDIQNAKPHSMLSVTILPTIYSNFLNIEPEWIFKIIYPFIFSFVPVGLFLLWKKNIGIKYAFISSFIFMAFGTFYYEMIALNRQIVAEVFLTLLLLTIFNQGLNKRNIIACFTIFTFGLVTSHYGTAIILFFFILSIYIYFLIIQKPCKQINSFMVLYFLITMLAWYIYTSNSSVLDAMIMMINYVLGQLGNFADPASRGQIVLRGLGLEMAPSIWNAISRVFAYTTELLIGVGFIGLITKKVKIQFDREYFILIATAIAFLAGLIIVPGLAQTMNMTRYYHILLFFLAPLCILGAETISNYISPKREQLYTSFLIIIILIPYFLFQSGFVYEITGSDNFSLPLSKHRSSEIELYSKFGFTPIMDVYGARWLSNNTVTQRAEIYADVYASSTLLGYGSPILNKKNALNNVTTISINGVIFLNKLNGKYNKILGEKSLGKNDEWNTTTILPLNNMNKVYSNGGSMIYINNNAPSEGTMTK